MENNINESEKEYIVLPSELHSFVYCPRYYFFERFMPHKRTLAERLRLFLGRLFHIFHGLFDKFRGYNVENPIVVSIGKVKIVGRPDSYMIKNDYLEVIERKSGKAPRRGAWLSDVVQASTYAFALSFNSERDLSTKIKIQYRNKTVTYDFNSDLVNIVLKVIEDLILVKYYGILPAANKGKRCEKCPFREFCTLLEEDPSLNELRENLLEPGGWIAHMKVASYTAEGLTEKRGSSLNELRERPNSGEGRGNLWEHNKEEEARKRSSGSC